MGFVVRQDVVTREVARFAAGGCDPDSMSCATWSRLLLPRKETNADEGKSKVVFSCCIHVRIEGTLVNFRVFDLSPGIFRCA